VIDYIQKGLEKPQSHEGFAYFYCNRNEQQRREPLCVLQSYVRQLSTATAYPEEMQKSLRRLCQELRLKGSHLSYTACETQILESINIYPKTTLVLDALDECDPHSRSRLIETIDLFLSKSSKPLKIFISSRPDGDIRDCFRSRPNIEIQATHNHKDIEKYVNGMIIKHRRWKKMPTPLQENIVKTLLDRSQGMYDLLVTRILIIY
jgi:ankyrin repeat domain-containing protein 50